MGHLLIGPWERQMRITMSSKKPRLILLLALAIASSFGMALKDATVMAQSQPASFWDVRSIHTADFGVANPVGLAYSPEANAFLVLDARQTSMDATSDATWISMSEDLVGPLKLTTIIT